VAQVAADLAISEQTIYLWRRQHLIDTGQLPGTTSSENAELVVARRRIAELEAEVAIHRRAAQLLGEVVSPKDQVKNLATELSGIPLRTGLVILSSHTIVIIQQPDSTQLRAHQWAAGPSGSAAAWNPRRKHQQRDAILGSSSPERLPEGAGHRRLDRGAIRGANWC
jgi:transposase